MDSLNVGMASKIHIFQNVMFKGMFLLIINAGVGKESKLVEVCEAAMDHSNKVNFLNFSDEEAIRR